MNSIIFYNTKYQLICLAVFHYTNLCKSSVLTDRRYLHAMSYHAPETEVT